MFLFLSVNVIFFFFLGEVLFAEPSLVGFCDKRIREGGGRGLTVVEVSYLLDRVGPRRSDPG